MTYEKAVDRYTESGFPNNAIALCNKILRNAPGRTPVYLKLAKLMVDRGFVAEAKRNLLEYAERMSKAGQLEDAFKALKEFADLSPDNEEIRLLLAEQLKAAARTDEAREQLAKLYVEVESGGDQRKTRATLEKMKAIDPEYDVESAPKPKFKRKEKTSELIFLDLDEPVPVAVEEPEPEEPEPLVEEPVEPAAATAVEDLPVEGIVELEPTAVEDEVPLEIEPTSFEEETEQAAAAVEEEPEEVLEIEPTSLEKETEQALSGAFEIQRASSDFLSIEEADLKTVDGLDTEAEFEAPAEEEVAALEFEATAIEEPPVEIADEELEVAEAIEEVEEAEEVEAVQEIEEEAELEAELEMVEELELAPEAEAELEELEELVEVPEAEAELEILRELEAPAEPEPVAEEPETVAEVEPEPAEELEVVAEAEVEPVEEVEVPPEAEFEPVEDVAVEEEAVEEEDVEVQKEVELEVVEIRPSYNELVVDVEEPDAIELAAATTGLDVEKPEEIQLEAADADIVDKPEEIELTPSAATDLGVEVEHEEEMWDEAEVGSIEVPELDLAGFDAEGAEAAEEVAIAEVPEERVSAEVEEVEEALAEVEEAAGVEGAEEVAVEEAHVFAEEAEEAEEDFDVALDSVFETPIVSAEEAEAAVAAELAEPVEEMAPPDLAQLEMMVADDPDDADLHCSLAEALIEAGERDRGLEELDIALRLHEQAEDWGQADRVVGEVLRVDPNSVRHHQKRVELSFQQGDKGRLAGAYLGLADALLRTDDVERARAVYHRVLEHDAENKEAELALSALEPIEDIEVPAGVSAEPEAPSDSDFVDLGALVLEEDEPIKNTRMRIEEEEPTGDEQKDFEEMLNEFKRGIEANLEDEDWQAHYDLGVAFKEMGLLDEAVGEFQKALRSAEGRLKTAEALGLCFFEKGQHSVAGTVLRRAVDSDPSGDEAKIGLLYWLARCEEEQGKPDDAMSHYQRVFAIDINFQDVEQRVRDIGGS